MQKRKLQLSFVIAILLSVATHILFFQWALVANHFEKQHPESRPLLIHLAQTSASLLPQPSHHSPPEQMPPEQMPPEQMPPEQMPPEQMPPEQMPPEQMPPAIFYEAAQLDSPPQAIEDIGFTYPKVGESFHLGGKVTLLLYINEYGKVEDVTVLDAMPQKVFDEAARAGFLNRQFQPGIKSGWPVKSKVKIEVIFPPLSELAR